MPTLNLSHGTNWYYQAEEYTDPWCMLETIGLRHGDNKSYRAWKDKVPPAARVVLPGDWFHAAATDPDACVAASDCANFVNVCVKCVA